MSENGSRDECLLERVESLMTREVKVPRNVLSGKMYQWNDNVRVVEDELAIKISKT